MIKVLFPFICCPYSNSDLQRILTSVEIIVTQKNGSVLSVLTIPLRGMGQ